MASSKSNHRQRDETPAYQSPNTFPLEDEFGFTPSNPQTNEIEHEFGFVPTPEKSNAIEHEFGFTPIVMHPTTQVHYTTEPLTFHASGEIKSLFIQYLPKKASLDYVAKKGNNLPPSPVIVYYKTSDKDNLSHLEVNLQDKKFQKQGIYKVSFTYIKNGQTYLFEEGFEDIQKQGKLMFNTPEVRAEQTVSFNGYKVNNLQVETEAGDKTRFKMSGDVLMTIKIINLASSEVNTKTIGATVRDNVKQLLSGKTFYVRFDKQNELGASLDPYGNRKDEAFFPYIEATFNFEVVYKTGYNQLTDIKQGDIVLLIVDSIPMNKKEGSDPVGLANGTGTQIASVEANNTWAATHEVFHLLGLSDEYKVLNGKSVNPNNGGNLMNAGQDQPLLIDYEQETIIGKKLVEKIMVRKYQNKNLSFNADINTLQQALEFIKQNNIIIKK